MLRTNDPYRDFEMYEAEKERWLRSQPVCSHCGEHIQDENCYVVNDEIICEDCMEKHFKKRTEDLA